MARTAILGPIPSVHDNTNDSLLSPRHGQPMYAVAHKIKIYKRAFPILPARVMLSRICALLSMGMALLIAGLAISLYATFDKGALISRPLLGPILGSEVLLILGSIQLLFDIEQAHFENRRAKAAPRSFRATIVQVRIERRNTIEELFDYPPNLNVLAKNLVKEWEWRHYITSRSEGPTDLNLSTFFHPPNASTLATYLTALFAVCLALVAITVEREQFFANLPVYWANFKALVLIAVHLALPIAVIVLGAGMLIKSGKLLLQNISHRLDADYLSQPAFYRFARELVELEDERQKRLLGAISTDTKWVIRWAMTPFPEWGRWWQVRLRAKNFAAIRALASAEHEHAKNVRKVPGTVTYSGRLSPP